MNPDTREQRRLLGEADLDRQERLSRFQVLPSGPVSKFTPGPWQVISKHEGKAFTKEWREIGPGVVAACSYDTNRWGEMETVPGVRITEANAHLISAAPEMLAVLKWFTHPDGLSSVNLRNNLSAARAAIAKAEGNALPPASPESPEDRAVREAWDRQDEIK